MNQYFNYYKPSLGGSWLLVALLIVGSVVGGGVNLAWKAAPQSLTYFIGMIPPLLWCGWMGRMACESGRSPLAVHAPHYGKLPVWAFLLLAGLILVAISFVIEPLSSAIPMPDSIKAIFEKAFVDSPLWDMIVSTCILAPLLEEFLCRGMMLRGMLTQMKPWKAIAWSAFLFAFMHLNPWQAIPAFLIGLFLGWVYWRTHSLWATIFLHCLNNSLSTLISRIWPDMPVDAGWKDLLPPNLYWFVYAGAAVLMVVLFYLLHEKTVSPQVPSPVDA